MATPGRGVDASVTGVPAGVHPVDEGVLRIPVPTPFAVGVVNVYLILGRVPTLVDVGPGGRRGREALEAGLAAAGLGWDDVAQVVITHTHADHMGLLRHWPGTRRPAVVGHRWGARHFRGGDDPERVRFFQGFVRSAGVPADVAGGLLQGLAALMAAEPAVSVARWLEDGDELTMGDDRWLVLHTPGHAQSQVCLYRERDGLLISSDHLLPTISSNALLEPAPLDERGRPLRPEPPRSLVDYRRSLRRVRPLPARRCLPGHGDPFGGHRELIERRLADMERRARQIRDALAARGGRSTLYRLAVDLFGSGDAGHLLLALSEVQGHVAWMESEGWVRCRPEPGGSGVLMVTAAGGAG
ncbi:MBL fold metallo-hydrolase [Thermaerobacter sp. FW80]|uniref:MBL fold metallo-hydrolase n=1 Tax=Thermaerobacter sp. FW80 TaxID=2546351 RepID=UPI0010755775|nr:MBL fold metallo-hydrolase [Thermaerobacter sp. FW80]QBS37754.1 MBL fold metallo-hydrolase [Thermaerobacter sp. FW80]